LILPPQRKMNNAQHADIYRSAAEDYEADVDTDCIEDAWLKVDGCPRLPKPWFTGG